LKQLLPPEMTLAQFALRWILMHDAVTCAIPGARRPAQVQENCAASGFPALPPDLMEQVGTIYRWRIAPLVHQRW
jgi:aryl-alcohol dehydrogenase-like predicted oxidoreductase